MPKDQTIDDVSPGSHRHDFENVVIWLSNDTTTVLGGAASGHGQYKITSGAVPGGDSPTVEYFATFPTNHELQFTQTAGNTYPVSDWDAMPDAAKKGLQDTDFGEANPPFKVSNWLSSNSSFSVPFLPFIIVGDLFPNSCTLRNAARCTHPLSSSMTLHQAAKFGRE